ncbi:hypothetical protein FQN54_001720 [Arachnomyces sp. PD_36]|nr:hypothetical protein FQN54_001720 [Arachnomyces sp. PD_36]
MSLPMFPTHYVLNPSINRDLIDIPFYCWHPIGSGATGTVHKVSDRAAVKIPHDSHHAQDLEWEHTVYLVLGVCPRIVGFGGIHSYGLILEYHPHGTVREFLHVRDKGLKTEDLFKWAIQITEGLNFIHGADLVQADVSLANVLIKEDRDVVLCDFASSQYKGRPIPKMTYEVRASRPSPDHCYQIADDLFALGSAIYEMETGHGPYHRKSDNQVKKLYAKGDFPSTRGLKLRNVIEKCWHVDYYEAQEVLDEIRSVEREWKNSFSQNKFSSMIKSVFGSIFRKSSGKEKEDTKGKGKRRIREV